MFIVLFYTTTSPLENVFERELHLAHAAVSGSDAAEVGAAERRVRQPPNRVIQDVERFGTELQFVALFDAEVLVGGEIPVKAPGAKDRVASGISEVIDRLQGEGGGVEPLVRGWGRQGNALARGVRTVIGDVGIGAVDAGGRIDRESGSPGHDGSQLPAAHHGIQESIAGIELPTL